ncbi:MAG: hypothetical protein N2378_11140 [Chloroflexaceae bacterium]|nr:hypothetical protein [Chloroflexaceae bacterium]
MHLRTHLLTSSALGLALYARQPERLAALVAAGTLIDLDHLVLYGLRTGDWSIVGALRYNRYRGRRSTAGDTRPRYGSLRSWLHNPWLALPLAWAWAGAYPVARPLALGLSLHLLLDHVDLPWRVRARLRAGGACQSCGRRGARLEVYRFRHATSARYLALCRACGQRAMRPGRIESRPARTARPVVHYPGEQGTTAHQETAHERR